MVLAATRQLAEREMSHSSRHIRRRSIVHHKKHSPVGRSVITSATLTYCRFVLLRRVDRSPLCRAHRNAPLIRLHFLLVLWLYVCCCCSDDNAAHCMLRRRSTKTNNDRRQARPYTTSTDRWLVTYIWALSSWQARPFVAAFTLGVVVWIHRNTHHHRRGQSCDAVLRYWKAEPDAVVERLAVLGSL